MARKLVERMRNIFDEKNVTIRKMADELEIDRTILQKFFTADRHLQMDVFQKLICLLDLSSQERAELYELYENEKAGPECFNNNRQFIDIYNNLNAFIKQNEGLSKSDSREFDYQITDLPIQIIEGKMQVKAMINNFFIEEMKRGKEAEIIMALNTEYALLDETITRFAATGKDGGKIFNIIPLVNKKKLGSNLKVLKTVLTMGCLKNIDYQPYYYYTGSLVSDDISMIMPYYFITSNYLLLIDRDFKTGIIVDRPNIISFYKEKAMGVIRNCELLIEKSVHESEVFLGAMVYEKADKKAIQFIHPETLKKYLTEKGCQNSKILDPLMYEILSEEKKRKPSIYLIREQFFEKETCAKFRCLEKNNVLEVVIDCPIKNQALIFSVKETGIVKSFSEFLNHLPDSVYVYSREEITNYYNKHKKSL